MATLIIKRTTEFNNRLRDYQLFLDGKKIGTIADGQTKEFETTPGQHLIIAKVDWCSSPELSLLLNETGSKKLAVGGFKSGKWITPVSIGIILLSFILRSYFYYSIFFIIPSFILLVYYLTVGRKKYLSLTEI